MKTETASAQISFRVTQAVAEELATRAKGLNLSPGEYARKLVVQSLAESIDPNLRPLTRRDLTAFFQELGSYLNQQLEAQTRDGHPTNLLGQVKHLREDLATVAVAFLVGIGNRDVDEATNFVQTRLLSRVLP